MIPSKIATTSYGRVSRWGETPKNNAFNNQNEVMQTGNNESLKLHCVTKEPSVDREWKRASLTWLLEGLQEVIQFVLLPEEIVCLHVANRKGLSVQNGQTSIHSIRGNQLSESERIN